MISTLSVCDRKVESKATHEHTMCTKLVMDTTDPDIDFDDQGVCNWWHQFHRIKNERHSPNQLQLQLDAMVSRIKECGKQNDYDCVLGISGGVDSSYLALLAKQWGLRPLVVHFDNGWNDELAVANIEKIVRSLGFDLSTCVMHWPEFRDLQRSYFKASVLDLEVPTDHMIFASLFQIASKQNIKFILSGNNFATESILPRSWYFSKSDLRNLLAVHRRHGEIPLKQLPRLGVWQRTYFECLRGIEIVEPLNLMDYRKLVAKKQLMSQFDWNDYGGKHYESVFTRFYQGYILPQKFGIDKRKAHLSNLICNGEITREDAIEELLQPTYEPVRQLEDKRYVAKKLGWSESEFDDLLSMPNGKQLAYGTDAVDHRRMQMIRRLFFPAARLFRRLMNT